VKTRSVDKTEEKIQSRKKRRRKPKTVKRNSVHQDREDIFPEGDGTGRGE
jgi:hypothetical protein